MPRYRFLIISHLGGILRSRSFVAGDDVAAIAKAEQYRENRLGMELWREDMLVCQVPPSNTSAE
jgi:hypothetical protein